jgi:hypothetical protein
MALTPSAVISSGGTTITPAIAAAASAYQHSFPLTPDGSCGNPAGTASGDNATSNNSNGVTSSSIYETNNGTNALQNNKTNNKDSMGTEEHNQRQQESYSAIQSDGGTGLDNNGQGLIQQQSENSDHHTPSYYTK